MDRCNKCGMESHYGAHGIRDGKVYSEYWCERCYNSRNTKKILTCQERPKTAADGTIWVSEDGWYKFKEGQWKRIF